MNKTINWRICLTFYSTFTLILFLSATVKYLFVIHSLGNLTWPIFVSESQTKVSNYLSGSVTLRINFQNEIVMFEIENMKLLESE